MLSPGAAWIVRDILEKNRRPDLPFDAFDLSAARQVAWKTGTSYGFRDAWAIGVTDRYTIGVWVGRPDGTPSPGQYGAATAAPILFDIVDGLPGRELWSNRLARPDSVQEAAICWPLGQPEEPGNERLCHEKRTAWILNDVIPPTLPDRVQTQWVGGRVRYWINPRTGLRVDAYCAAEPREARELARWPTVLEPWLGPDIRRRTELPAMDASCSAHNAVQPAAVRIVGLAPQTVLRGINGVPPALSLSTVGGEGNLYWLINGRMIKSASRGHSFNYRFDEPGIYEITVMDQHAHFDRVRVKVLR